MTNKIKNEELVTKPSLDNMKLILLEKELKLTKFSDQLENIGFKTNLISLSLGEIILSSFGFKEQTDELWSWYHDTLDDLLFQRDLKDLRYAKELAETFYNELLLKYNSEITQKLNN